MEVTEKRCTHCHKMKPASSYSKRKTSPDGLQLWCKQCQSESSKNLTKTRNSRRHNSMRKKVEYYKKHHGLVYYNPDSNMKTAYLKNIGYNCLKCGNNIEEKLKDACDHSFVCKDCSATPLKKYTRLDKHKTISYSISKEPQESNKSINNANLKQELLQLLNDRCSEQNSFDFNDKIKVVVVPIPIEKPVEKKSGLFGWVKRLFH